MNINEKPYNIFIENFKRYHLQSQKCYVTVFVSTFTAELTLMSHNPGAKSIYQVKHLSVMLHAVVESVVNDYTRETGRLFYSYRQVKAAMDTVGARSHAREIKLTAMMKNSLMQQSIYPKSVHRLAVNKILAVNVLMCCTARCLMLPLTISPCSMPAKILFCAYKYNDSREKLRTLLERHVQSSLKYDNSCVNVHHAINGVRKNYLLFDRVLRGQNRCDTFLEKEHHLEKVFSIFRRAYLQPTSISSSKHGAGGATPESAERGSVCGVASASEGTEQDSVDKDVLLIIGFLIKEPKSIDAPCLKCIEFDDKELLAKELDMNLWTS